MQGYTYEREINAGIYIQGWKQWQGIHVKWKKMAGNTYGKSNMQRSPGLHAGKYISGTKKCSDHT
jgi:hypothetical protein